MANFFDIQYNQTPTSLEEYIKNISCVIKRARVIEMFKFAILVLRAIKISYSSDFQIPEIRITFDESVPAEATEYAINISHGFIEYCLKSEFAFIDDLLDEPIDLNYNLISENMLAWTVAHEFTHVVRKHNELLRILGVDSLTMRALEWDADLCAIAIIYRLLQLRYSQITSDLNVRLITIYSVFWPIRKLQNNSMQISHLTIEHRIYHLIGKLAMLGEGKYDLPDKNWEKSQTLEINNRLLDLVVELENHFLSVNRLSEEASLLHVILEYIATGKHLEVVGRWDEIRDTVSRVSGTRT